MTLDLEGWRIVLCVAAAATLWVAWWLIRELLDSEVGNAAVLFPFVIAAGLIALEAMDRLERMAVPS